MIACIPFDVAYSTVSVWMQRLPGSVAGDWWCCWYDGFDCACVGFDVDGRVDLYKRVLDVYVRRACGTTHEHVHITLKKC